MRRVSDASADGLQFAQHKEKRRAKKSGIRKRKAHEHGEAHHSKRSKLPSSHPVN